MYINGIFSLSALERDLNEEIVPALKLPPDGPVGTWLDWVAQEKANRRPDIAFYDITVDEIEAQILEETGQSASNRVN